MTSGCKTDIHRQQGSRLQLYLYPFEAAYCCLKLNVDRADYYSPHISVCVREVSLLTHCLLGTAVTVLALAVVRRGGVRSLLFSFGFLLLGDIGFLLCERLMSLDGGSLGGEVVVGALCAGTLFEAALLLRCSVGSGLSKTYVVGYHTLTKQGSSTLLFIMLYFCFLVY